MTFHSPNFHVRHFFQSTSQWQHVIGDDASLATGINGSDYQWERVSMATKVDSSNVTITGTSMEEQLD